MMVSHEGKEGGGGKKVVVVDDGLCWPIHTDQVTWSLEPGLLVHVGFVVGVVVAVAFWFCCCAVVCYSCWCCDCLLLVLYVFSCLCCHKWRFFVRFFYI